MLHKRLLINVIGKLLYPAIFLWGNISAAQQAIPYDRYLVKHFSSDIFPQSTTVDMLQDGDGFWWIVTHNGLMRFDGSGFVEVTHPNIQKNNTPICHLAKDIRGRLFAFDSKSGIYLVQNKKLILVPKDGPSYWRPSFDHRIVRLTATQDFPKPQALSPVIRLPDNDIYSLGEHPFIFNLHSQAANYQYLRYLPGHVAFGQFTNIFSLGTTVYVFNPNGGIEIFYKGKMTGRTHFSGDILNDNNYVNPKLSANIRIKYAGDRPFLIAGSTIYSIREAHGNIETKKWLGNIPIKTQIQSIGIDSLSGTILLGTVSDGIYQLRKKFFQTFFTDTDIPADNIFYCTEQINGNKYYSSKGFVFELYTNKILERLVDGSFQDTYSLYKDGNDIYQAMAKGLYRLNTQSSPLHLVPVCRYADGLSNMHKIQAGKYWYCSHHNIGILEHDSITHSDIFRRLGAGITQINNFYFTGPDTMMIGTDMGLFRYCPKTDQIRKIRFLGNANVRTFIPDSAGSYWICTYGQGLYYCRDNNYYNTQIPTLKTPHCVIKDNNGYLWISSNHGLYRIAIKELLQSIKSENSIPKYTVYTVRDGLLTNEFNGGGNPSSNAMSDSLFLLPSMKGLVYFNPLLVTDNYTSFPIQVEYVTLNDSVTVPPRHHLILPHDFFNATFTFSHPYYGNVSEGKMEYRLENNDLSWHAIPSNNKLTINGLRPGKYILKAKAINSDSIVEFPFEVGKPLWQEIWFLLLVFISISGISYIILLFYFRSKLKEKKKLEQLVIERTAELQASNEKLHNNSIFRERVLAIIFHDIHSPLKYISRLSKSLYKKSKIIGASDSSNKEQMDTLIHNLYDINNQFILFSENILQWVKVQGEISQLTPINIQLYNFTHKIMDIYADIALDKGILLLNIVPPTIYIATDATVLHTIIRNIVDNAIKHTDQGNIEVSAQPTTDGIIMTIRDSGEGIPSEKLEKIRQDLGRLDTLPTAGLGLFIIKNMLALINGNIQIESSGNGTIIHVAIPHLALQWRTTKIFEQSPQSTDLK